MVIGVKGVEELEIQRVPIADQGGLILVRGAICAPGDIVEAGAVIGGRIDAQVHAVVGGLDRLVRPRVPLELRVALEGDPAADVRVRDADGACGDERVGVSPLGGPIPVLTTEPSNGMFSGPGVSSTSPPASSRRVSSVSTIGRKDLMRRAPEEPRQLRTVDSCVPKVFQGSLGHGELLEGERLSRQTGADATGVLPRIKLGKPARRMGSGDDRELSSRPEEWMPFATANRNSRGRFLQTLVPAARADGAFLVVCVDRGRRTFRGS